MQTMQYIVFKVWKKWFLIVHKPSKETPFFSFKTRFFQPVSNLELKYSLQFIEENNENCWNQSFFQFIKKTQEWLINPYVIQITNKQAGHPVVLSY